MSIKDVAKAANVSPSTVSRVVNGGDVSAASPETQERIWKAVREVGYVLNQNARSLKCAKPKSAPASRDIDCVFARIAGPHLDPFFTSLMHEIELEAFEHGYHLRYQYSINEVTNGTFLPRGDARAAIVLGRASEQTITRLKSLYRYLICASLQNLNLPVDQVISSGYDAAYSCVQYLHTLGHTRICYLGETVDEQRYEGYLAAMRQIGCENAEELSIESPFTPTDGYEAIHELLTRDKDFTAILCSNDMLAIGALNALKKHKLLVPRDVSLIGINDMETVRYLDPMLTTINIPVAEMGKQTAKMLIDRINGGHKLPVKVLIPNALVCRDSCAQAAIRTIKVVV